MTPHPRVIRRKLDDMAEMIQGPLFDHYQTAHDERYTGRVGDSVKVRVVAARPTENIALDRKKLEALLVEAAAHVHNAYQELSRAEGMLDRYAGGGLKEQPGKTSHDALHSQQEHEEYLRAQARRRERMEA